jgi:hypothetical protein
VSRFNLDRLHLDRKRLIIVTAAVIALALLGAVVAIATSGGDDKKPTAEAPPASTTTSTTVAPPIAPLTGKLADPALIARPAIIVKIDNSPSALPLQEGVDRADIVFVEQVEGGTTRMAAVFQSQNAEPGPIRSARTSDLAIAPSFGLPLFTNSGGNAGVIGSVQESKDLIDTGISSPGAAAVFNRHQRGSDVHRFFVPLEELYAIRAGQGKPPAPLFNFRVPGQLPVGTPAGGVDVVYAKGGTRVHYQWNGEGWQRTQDGRLHQMANGGPLINPANVIVMSTPYVNSGYVDVGGNPSPEAVLTGGGEALILTAGNVIHGQWRGIDQGGRLSFLDELGLPIALTPGQTFIELDTPGGATPF